MFQIVFLFVIDIQTANVTEEFHTPTTILPPSSLSLTHTRIIQTSSDYNVELRRRKSSKTKVQASKVSYEIIKVLCERITYAPVVLMHVLCVGVILYPANKVSYEIRDRESL